MTIRVWKVFASSQHGEYELHFTALAYQWASHTRACRLTCSNNGTEFVQIQPRVRTVGSYITYWGCLVICVMANQQGQRSICRIPAASRGCVLPRSPAPRCAAHTSVLSSADSCGARNASSPSRSISTTTNGLFFLVAPRPGCGCCWSWAVISSRSVTPLRSPRLPSDSQPSITGAPLGFPGASWSGRADWGV